MEKNNVILVFNNPNLLKTAMNYVNLETVNIVAILMDGGDGKVLTINKTQQVHVYSFAVTQQIIEQGKNFSWLICGGWFDTTKMKKFLEKSGVPKENIFNFSVYNHVTPAWIANIRYAEKNPVDFFATGISYTEVGLDFNCFPKLLGINLACSSQDLRQGYLTAKYFFEKSPSKIKFVLIGITPYSFSYDNTKSFAVYPRELQFIWTLKNFENPNPPPQHINFLESLVSEEAKKTFSNITEEQADLSNSNVRNNNNRNFPASATVDWQEDFKFVVKKFYPETFEKNLQIFEDYIKLCLENGAKPVAVTFPFAKIIRENYPQETLTYFRHLLKQFEKIYDFKFVDLFDLPLDYSCFYNGQHLNLKGSYLASSVLAYNLFKENILSAENFREMNQNFFNALAALIPKDEYEKFKEKIFSENGND